MITSRQHSNRYGSLGYASQSKTESSVVHQNPTKETAKPLAEAAASKQVLQLNDGSFICLLGKCNISRFVTVERVAHVW